MNCGLYFAFFFVGIGHSLCYKGLNESMTSSTNHASKLFIRYGSLNDIYGKFALNFHKYVEVFDLYFVATNSSADEKVLHGARVLYQYIDNNDDGKPDNNDVYNTLVTNKAIMYMFRDEEERNNVFSSQDFNTSGFLAQDLQADETRPGSIIAGAFDAALEECFHLLTIGYVKQYPDIFGIEAGSLIANAMDVARGGQFLTIPNTYPPAAWYTYDDDTCGYACQIIEYMYWGMSSVLGAQIHRKEEIKDEWKLTLRREVQEKDSALLHLLTNESYKFPTKLPQPVNESYIFPTKPQPSSKSGCFLRSCSCLMCFMSFIFTSTVIALSG